jgi:hypothetical protein
VRSDELLLADDIRRGAGPIAVLMFGADTPQNRRRVYHLAERPNDGNVPPFFREAAILCLRRSAYLGWIESRENATPPPRARKRA